MPKDGIKPGMGHTIFRGETHGFRLHVQDDSVPAHRPMDETSGPVTVELWEEIFRFEGAVLKGVLKVECLPDRRRFEAPLLFDFLVEDGKKADPIIDRQCRNRYEVSIGRAPSSTIGISREKGRASCLCFGDHGTIESHQLLRRSGW